MRIPAGSHWAAGATGEHGRPVVFDTPGCLFRYRLSAAGRQAREPWVTEYYGPAGPRTPATTVRYVVGSDVVGPMGPDLIPVDPGRIEPFRRDHHARAVYTFESVTEEILRAL